MSLQRTLGYIRDASRTFAGGTQIVGREEVQQAHESYLALLSLMDIAKQKGATPYEVSRAFQGEVIGESFLTDLVEVS